MYYLHNSELSFIGSYQVWERVVYVLVVLCIRVRSLEGNLRQRSIHQGLCLRFPCIMTKRVRLLKLFTIWPFSAISIKQRK